ncbi:MAG: ArsA-related P-loop ATPase [Candidatus Altiarchaeota archaeon]
MKIAVTGKGGVGKTSIAAALGIILSRDKDVILVDADPSLNLATVFNRDDITPISKMKELADERARLPDGLVRMNPEVRDIVDRYAVEVQERLKLLVAGTVTEAGKGCMCPENAILRSLLQEIVLKRDEIVIVDMEAGLEPMSRGTIRRVDSILIVTEADRNSVSVTKRLMKFASDLGIGNAVVVANKVRDDGELKFLKKELEIDHSIPFDDEFMKLFRAGKTTTDTKFHTSVSKLADLVREYE